MACGNTDVLRAGLGSQPSKLSHPTRAMASPTTATETSLSAIGDLAVREFDDVLGRFTDPDHILAGGPVMDRNGNMNISGMHHLPAKPASARRMITFKMGDNNNLGVYLEIETPQGVATKRDKRSEEGEPSPHTAFDPALSPVDVLREVVSAFESSEQTGKGGNQDYKWRGTSSSGNVIEGWATPAGQIKTAYPEGKSTTELWVKH